MAAGERRSTTGNAVTTSPTANFNSAATTIPMAASTGYPDGTNGPFFIQVDSEVIKCISRTGLNISVQTTPVTGRGWDGTTAASHTTSSVINFVFTATDADDANKHYADVSVDNHTQYLNNARHDISGRHPITVLPTGSPGNSVPGDTAAAGTAPSLARSDHTHGREADSTTRVGVTLSVAAQVLPSATSTAVPWTTETTDTDGFIVTNGSNTVLTVPAGKGGIYDATVNGQWTTSFTEASFVFIQIGSNGYVGPADTSPFVVNQWSFSIAGIPIAAAQTITVALVQTNAASKTTSVMLNLYRVSA